MQQLNFFLQKCSDKREGEGPLSDPCWVPRRDGVFVVRSAEMLHRQPVNQMQDSVNHSRVGTSAAESSIGILQKQPFISYLFLGFTSHPSRHLRKVSDFPGEMSIFSGSSAQNVNL